MQCPRQIDAPRTGKVPYRLKQNGQPVILADGKDLRQSASFGLREIYSRFFPAAKRPYVERNSFRLPIIGKAMEQIPSSCLCPFRVFRVFRGPLPFFLPSVPICVIRGQSPPVFKEKLLHWNAENKIFLLRLLRSLAVNPNKFFRQKYGGQKYRRKKIESNEPQMT